jgi:hypothetical protein
MPIAIPLRFSRWSFNFKLTSRRHRDTIGLQPMELQLQPNKHAHRDTIALQPMELQPTKPRPSQ